MNNEIDKSLMCKYLNLTRNGSNAENLRYLKKCNDMLIEQKWIWDNVIVPHIPNDEDKKKRQRIVILMGYTAASGGESLNAIKMANDLLNREGLAWNQVLPDIMIANYYPIYPDGTQDKKESKKETHRQTRNYESAGYRAHTSPLQTEILEVLGYEYGWILKSELVKKVCMMYNRNSGAVYRQITASEPTSKYVRTGNLIERGLIDQQGDYIRLRIDS